MKTIGQDEFYQNITDFLKSRGIELTDGAYARHIRRACGLLSDAINAAQRTVKRAKDEVDQKLVQLRQSIHEATAQGTPEAPSPAAPPPRARRPGRTAPKRPTPKPARRRRATPGGGVSP